MNKDLKDILIVVVLVSIIGVLVISNETKQLKIKQLEDDNYYLQNNLDKVNEFREDCEERLFHLGD